MAMTEVTVIVDGVENMHETYRSTFDAAQLIQRTERDARETGLPTEVYIVDHPHDDDITNCLCVQYVPDHRPTYEWNTTD